MRVFEIKSRVPLPPDAVFEWHRRPYAFNRVMAPWEKTESSVVSHDFKNGGKVQFAFCLGPVRIPWLAEYRDVVPGRQFVDVQLKGPFPFWRHTHRFDPDGSGTQVVDRVEYDLPGGAFGRLLGGKYAHDRLVRMFHYRHGILKRDLVPRTSKKKRVAITGSTGLIGTALVALLSTQGHEVVRFVRRSENLRPDERSWNPSTGELHIPDLEGFDTIIHLAGESVAGRWNARRKQAILISRIDSTKLLAQAMARLNNPPESFLCASAVGFYGHGGDDELNEATAAGSGFLPDVCRRWEDAAANGLPTNVRLVLLRIGMVLSSAGGALRSMLPVFRIGMGAPLALGKCYMPWVTLDDAVSLIQHAMEQEAISGPLNVVAPAPVTNREFTRTLCQVLRRPMAPSVPAPLVKALVGELAEALLLSSLRVVPNKAIETGYRFHHKNLEEGLRWVLGRDAKSS